MQDNPTSQASLPDSAQNDQPLVPTIYEQMHWYLYDYRFGRITFIELLDKWKEVLQLPSRDKQ